MQTPDLLYQLAGATIYYAFGYGDEQLIDVPIGVLAEANSPSPELTQFLQAAGLPFGQTPLYQMIDGRRQAITPAQLQQAGYRQADVTAVSATFLNRLPAATSLLISSPEVNLRQGPGTGYEVIGQATSGQELLPVARTQDNSWFEVSDQGRSAWVAASVTHFNGDLSSLPQAELAVLDAAITATPTVEPVAAVVAEVTPVKLVCDEVPIRGFGQVWADHPEIQATLGCPYTFEGGEQGTSAAVQRFEHGWMVWVAQDQVYNGDPVYVFFEDDSAFQRFGDLGPADPAKMGQTKAGFYPVGDQFSKVYWEGTGARVKERLGNAVSEAKYSAGAFQNFWQGRMLWVDEVERIFVVYDYSYYDEAASVTQYVKVWGVYKDTF
jgi:uncharacterized protein YraI